MPTVIVIGVSAGSKRTVRRGIGETRSFEPAIANAKRD
jgi:hypothetical protein